MKLLSTMEAEQILEHLGSSEQGLSTAEVEKRIVQFRANEFCPKSYSSVFMEALW